MTCIMDGFGKNGMGVMANIFPFRRAIAYKMNALFQPVVQKNFAHPKRVPKVQAPCSFPWNKDL